MKKKYQIIVLFLIAGCILGGCTVENNVETEENKEKIDQISEFFQFNFTGHEDIELLVEMPR